MWASCSISLVVSDEAKSEDLLVPEGRLNGEKEAQEEMEEVRRELLEKNGFKMRFMFNIADGGFTGEVWAGETAKV